MPSTLLSHHLRTLREGGLVETERAGKSIIYRLSPRFDAHCSGKGIDLRCCKLLFD